MTASFAAGPRFLRETCGKIREKAVLQGICGPTEFWWLSPDELRLRFDAAREAEARKLRLLDTLSWLMGQYVAVALNAPRRYPPRPNRVRTRAATDEEMKRVLRTMATRANNYASEGQTQSKKEADAWVL